MSTTCPHCGCLIEKERSVPDHRRLFGLIKKAFMHWPERAEFQAANEESLRAFLLVEAGYHEVHHIPFSEGCADPEVARAIRLAVEATVAAVSRRSSYARTRVSASGVEIFTPRSISFASLGQKEFNAVRDAVTEIIENTIGVSADELLREEAA